MWGGTRWWLTWTAAFSFRPFHALCELLHGNRLFGISTLPHSRLKCFLRVESEMRELFVKGHFNFLPFFRCEVGIFGNEFQKTHCIFFHGI